MKYCATCKEEKPNSEFHAKADSKDGYYPHCRVCRKNKDKIHRAANSERLKQFDRDRYKIPARRKAQLESHKAKYEANKDVMIAKMAEYAKANPDIVRKAKKAYKVRNPHKLLANTRKRQISKLQAMPKWANEFFIAEAYDLARLRTAQFGFKWHVDHTVPLQNKLVSGLHCESNLSVIPAVDNLRKHNKYWPDMPDKFIVS